MTPNLSSHHSSTIQDVHSSQILSGQSSLQVGPLTSIISSLANIPSHMMRCTEKFSDLKFIVGSDNPQEPSMSMASGLLLGISQSKQCSLSSLTAYGTSKACLEPCPSSCMTKSSTTYDHTVWICTSQ